MKKIVGTRMLKTGIAVTIALSVSQLLGISSNFAGVVALIGLKPTTKKTVHYGSTLFIGSIFTLIIGLLIGYYLGQDPLAFGIATILAISLLVATHLTEGLILAIVVMYHVLEAFPIATASEFWSFSFHELIIIMIGILSSIVVNLAAPQRFNQFIEEGIHQYYRLFSHYLKQLSAGMVNPNQALDLLNIEEYHQHRNSLKHLIDKAEIGKGNCFQGLTIKQYETYIYKLKRLQKLLRILEDMTLELHRIKGTYPQSNKVVEAFNQLANIQINPEIVIPSIFADTKESYLNINEYFKDSPLPESREEFLDRSSLHHLFLYVQEYLEVLAPLSTLNTSKPKCFMSTLKPKLQKHL